MRQSPVWTDKDYVNDAVSFDDYWNNKITHLLREMSRNQENT